jgi:hypothetical protein
LGTRLAATNATCPYDIQLLNDGGSMGILKALGAVLIVAWLVLWLAVKITFGAVHLLLVIGLALLVYGFIKAKT